MKKEPIPTLLTLGEYKEVEKSVTLTLRVKVIVWPGVIEDPVEKAKDMIRTMLFNQHDILPKDIEFTTVEVQDLDEEDSGEEDSSIISS